MRLIARERGTSTVMSTDKIVAKEIRKAASEWLARGRKSFKGDQHMIDTYRNDAASLRSVAKLVSMGALTAARDSAARLDTIIRDEIPESFFKLLEIHNIQW